MYIGSEDKKTTSASKSIAILLCGKDEEIEGLEAVRPHSPKTSPVVQTLGKIWRGLERERGSQEIREIYAN